MPFPDRFPDLRPLPAKRRSTPDYTQRSTKWKLFAAAAAVMFVLFLIERGPALLRLPLDEGRGVRQQPTAVGERGSPTAEAPKTSVSQTAADGASADLGAILAGFGLGSAELARFTDGQRLTSAEVELLARILDRLPHLRYELFRARQPRTAFHTIVSAPAEHRGDVIAISGRARHAVKEILPEELAERFDFRDYYRVLVDLDGFGQTVALFARRIPRAWPLNELFEEPIAADALFLKVAEPDAHTPLLAFAAERVAWLPKKSNRELGVGPAEIELASLGMDIGLWDDVRKANHRPLEASDREAFYQLLAAVGQPRAMSLLSPTGELLPIGELLRRPQQFQGSVQRVAGTARRIKRIEVTEADVQARLGIDHYYEIDLFVPLGEANVKLGETQPGKPAPEFRNTFPATLVVRELPPGLTPQDNLHEQISASAVYFKIWTYDSRYTARFGQVQPAPLFVAAQPRLIEVPVVSDGLGTTLVTTALGLSLVLFMLVLWWSARPPRRTASPTAAPDFSQLR